MEDIHKKTTNGVGHNSNILKDKSPTAEAITTVSKEQYQKAVNSLHHFTQYARQELANVRIKYDRAFTGYWRANGNKLKTHEKHEQRIEANDRAYKFNEECDEQVAYIEEKARAQDLKLDEWETENKPEDKSDR